MSDQHPFLEALVRRSRCSMTPLTVAVAFPADRVALLGAIDLAMAGGFAPLLVGPARRIHELAGRCGTDPAALEILDADNEIRAARAAVEAVRTGRADLLMKGSLHTSAFLRAVLEPEAGLRGPRRASHIFVCDVPGWERPILVTDAVVNVAPGMAEKADICRNAIELAHVLGIERPRVAVLSATETVDPAIASTVDAAALAKMADRGEIVGGVVDGPLALDDAVSPGSASVKHIVSDVAGHADILVVPNLEAGNILYKSFVHMAGAAVAGVVLGTRVPLIVTSRADTLQSRLASAALAGIWLQGASAPAPPAAGPIREGDP